MGSKFIAIIIALLVAGLAGAMLLRGPVKPVQPIEPTPKAQAELRAWKKNAQSLKTAEALNKELSQLLQAAERGDMVAQYKAGMLYEMDGIDCLPSDQGLLGSAAGDFQNAQAWFLKSSEQGYLPALAALGNMYVWGVSALGRQGVDYAKGLALLKQAAAQGSASAMRDLGHMYGQGHGVVFDCTEMLHWHGMGADHGDFDSMLSLARAYGDKICVDRKDPALAYAWGYLSGVGDEKPKNMDPADSARADAFIADWRAKHPHIILMRESGDR